MKYLRLMRIKHYLKNMLVFLPLFFSKQILDANSISLSVAGFICFCLISSIVYIFNDIIDVENDRKHPVKKQRPIASGEVTIRQAVLLIIFLIIFIIIVSVFLTRNLYSTIYLMIYAVINILYSLRLKEKPIIDIVILSFGFLLRILYGGSIINVEISNWLYLTVLSISFYMSMGKRRNELIKNGNSTRKVLKYYNINFLDKNMCSFLTLAIVFFSFWIIELKINYMIWLIPIMFVICLRYSMNIENTNSYGDPIDVIVNDKLLLFLGLFLIAGMILFIYII